VKAPLSGVYFGKVTHHRLRPVAHHLAYDVASVFVDLDDLAVGHLPFLLSRNRFNMFSIHDRDHGERADEAIRDFAWRTVRQVSGSETIKRIYMLCYPRILGYGFNPLTAYFAVDANGMTRVVIYEVHNTFGGRHSYVTEMLEPGSVNVSRTEKVLRVSPFNKVEGTYILRTTEPRENVVLAVAHSTSDGPLLNAYFSGHWKPLDNVQLLRVFFGLPLMTLKVIAAIHWEALKLWKKGLKLQQ
jgi:uncharacterized protein